MVSAIACWAVFKVIQALTINRVPARASVESVKVSVYGFDQSMRHTDAQAASTLRELVFERSEVSFFGRLNFVDARCRCHRGQHEWT